MFRASAVGTETSTIACSRGVGSQCSWDRDYTVPYNRAVWSQCRWDRNSTKAQVAVLGASAAVTSETSQYSRAVRSKCSCDSAQYPTVGVLGASAVGTETSTIPYSRGGHLRHGQN